MSKMKVLITLIYFLILIGGLGVRDVTQISFFLLLSLGIYEAVKESERFVLFTNLLIFFIVSVCPSYTLLLGFLAITAFSNKSHRHVLLPILLVWLAQIIGIKILPVFATFIGLVCFSLMYCKIGQYISQILVCICPLIMIGEVFSYLNKKDYCIEEISVAKEQYKPGLIFSKLARCPIVDSTQIKNEYIIRSYAIGSKIQYEEKGISILENSPLKTNAIVTGGKWQQPVSWHDNIFCGDQYLVEAIAKDGGLWSNIGTNLKDTCQVILAFRNFRHGFQPLIIKNEETIYLHDSDYTSGRMSNYQKSFIQELVSPVGFGRPLQIRMINVVILLFILLLLIPFPKRRGQIIMYILGGGILLTSCGHFLLNNKGEVRLVGEIKDSHENNRFDGVIKTMIDDGFYYTIGEEDCKIVVVQENHSTSYNRESIVILEPNASIKIQGTKYVAGTIPTPPVQIDSIYVQDPRKIKINNKIVEPVYKLNMSDKEITIIATGSPALLEWKQILK